MKNEQGSMKKQWKMNTKKSKRINVQWNINEQWIRINDQWTMNDEQWTMNNEQWTMNDEQRTRILDQLIMNYEKSPWMNDQ